MSDLEKLTDVDVIDHIDHLVILWGNVSDRAYLRELVKRFNDYKRIAYRCPPSPITNPPPSSNS